MNYNFHIQKGDVFYLNPLYIYDEFSSSVAEAMFRNITDKTKDIEVENAKFVKTPECALLKLERKIYTENL